MPVAHVVRNNKEGPTVVSDVVTGQIVEWGGVGSEDGSDVQPVPEDIWNRPSFQSALRKGVFAVIDDESLTEQAQQAQREAYEQRQRETERASEVVIEPSQDRDMVFAEQGSETKPDLVQVSEGAPHPSSSSAAPSTPSEMVAEGDSGTFDENGHPVNQPLTVTMGDPLPSQQ